MNFRETLEAARLRAAAWNRERKERAEEKRAARAIAHPEHGHGKFFLLTIPATATICAAVVEWYWAVLFCIEATGRIDWNYETSFGSAEPASSVFNFAFATHWPVFLGLVCATIPIVMLSMVWLPVQFSMRGTGRWRRGTVIMCGLLANILVIVSGTVVMNYNRQDQVRESVVIEQTAAQGRAAIDARLQFEQEQLRLAMNNANPYLNQAANVGAAEWERSYVAQARASNDPRLPMLERALGAARAADARRANIERLTIERAQAAPEAASAANVEDTVGAELNTFAQYVEVWRPPFVAVICTLIGIFGAWWVLALIQGLNPRDVLRSGWAPEGLRLEDQRAEAPIPKQTYKRDTATFTRDEKGNDEIMLDEDGSPLKEVRYWRREDGKPMVKNRPASVNVQPDIPADDTPGDGGRNHAPGAYEQAMSGAMEGERESGVIVVAPPLSSERGEDEADSGRDGSEGIAVPFVDEQAKPGRDGGNGEAADNAPNEGNETPQSAFGGVDGALAVDQDSTSTEPPPAEDMSDEELNAALWLAPDDADEQVEETFAVDVSPAALAMEEGLPAAEQQADEPTAEADIAAHEDPQEERRAEVREDRLLPAK